MQRQPVKSSQIASVGYDHESGILEIEFANGGNVYQYQNVTPEIYNGLMKGDSIGKFFHAFIRSRPEKHPYRKVEGTNAESKEIISTAKHGA